jgi:2-C-methyl-D-erythritol 4-phosphate cytidylyltransferase
VRSALLVAAAGAGERLGRRPKGLLVLAGRPLLRWCLDSLAGAVDEVVIACPPGAEDRFAKLAGPHARAVTGGTTRQESVRAALAASSGELIAVHDVARPFATRELLVRVLAAAATAGAATAALPVVDTLVRETARGLETVDRDGVSAVQTPQAFLRAVLEAAHAQAARNGWQSTDDASLARRAGARVALVEGERYNLKITTPADLALADEIARWLASR